MSNELYEEMACWYIQQVTKAIDQALGAPGEWAAARKREKQARAVLAKHSAQFAAQDGIGGFGHFKKYISGDVALRAAFVLHPEVEILAGTGIAPDEVVDDGVPQVTTCCVGVLEDGRAVHFYAILSLAQALGNVPPDQEVMGKAVRRSAALGELEWWWWCE